MALSKVELACLSSVADDYENLEIISGMVSEPLGRLPSEGELLEGLAKLKHLGLVKFYSHPNPSNVIDSIPEQRANWAFSVLITPKGIETLNSELKD